MLCRACSAHQNLPINEGWWKELVLIRTHIFMDRCNGYELVLDTGWRKRDGWDIWPGPGTMNTKKNEKESQSHDGFRTTTIS